MGQYLNQQFVGPGNPSGYYCGDPITLNDPAVPEWPEAGSTWNGAVWVAPVVPSPTPAQQALATYNAAISAGLTVISTSVIPSMAAPGVTVAIADQAINRINSEQVSILTRQLYTNGQTARGWLDVIGGAHILPTTAAGTEFFEAIGTYMDALIQALATAQAGGTAVWPAATVTIA